MIKPTKHNLKKIQGLFEALDYIIRFEKGNFQSGYCILDSRNIIIVNKFFDTEAKINCLVEILGQIKIDETLLEGNELKFYKRIIA